jgi:hypothetical protein
VVALALASALLAACGVGVADINARPDKFYQKQVAFTGRIARRQILPAETLLEIADVRGSRILVRSKAPVDLDVGEWVTVRGLLVPEARVGDVVVYDVVDADRIERGRRPRFTGIM